MGAAAAAAAVVGSSVISSMGSRSAASKQAKSAERASALQQRRFEDVKSTLSPFVTMGAKPQVSNLPPLEKPNFGGGFEGALLEQMWAKGEHPAQIERRQQEQKNTMPPSLQRQLALSGSLGKEEQEKAYRSYQESPGVAWQREQGMRGINQAMSASGGLGGGSRLKAMSEFNQQLAQQDFANQYNRLGSLSGMSLSAASALGGVSQAATTGQSNAMQTAGAAQGQGIAGQLGALAYMSNRGGGTDYSIPMTSRDYE